MHIEVTDEDIALALERAGANREQHFQNPLTIALERIYCEGGRAGHAVVTMERAHVVSRGLTGSFILTRLGREFLEAWRGGYCRPKRSLLIVEAIT